MFFLISKLLDFLVDPIIWIFIILVLILLIKKPKIHKQLIIVELILVFILGNTFIIDEVMRFWEVDTIKATSINKVYDVGIVLGGGMVGYDLRKDKVFYPTSPDRFMQAIDLYKKKKIKKIMLVGGAGDLLYKDVKEALFLKDIVLTMGVSASDLFIESNSDNTHQNAINSKLILDSVVPNGKYLLITSGYHLKRAMKCFNKAGIIVEPYATNPQHGLRRFAFEYLFIPNYSNLSRWHLFLHELIGYYIYWFANYI